MSRDERFSQDVDDIAVVSRASSRTLLTDEVLDAGRKRIAAGEDPDKVATELAHFEVEITEGLESDEEPRFLEFNPDQPRDERGQWTAGGLSGFPDDNELRTEDMSGDANEEARERGERYIEKLRSVVENDSGATADDYAEMIAGMEHYQGDGYIAMNSNLRRDPEWLDSLDEYNDDDDEEDEDDRRPSSRGDKLLRDAAALQRMLDEAPRLKEAVLTYRGVTLTPELREQLVPGTEVVLNGFQSTTFDPAVAYGFAKEGSFVAKGGSFPKKLSEDSAVFEIRTKEGLEFGEWSKVGETEFLIGHGERFLVRGARKQRIKTSNGIKEVYMIQLEHNRAVRK